MDRPLSDIVLSEIREAFYNTPRIAPRMTPPAPPAFQLEPEMDLVTAFERVERGTLRAS